MTQTQKTETPLAHPVAPTVTQALADALELMLEGADCSDAGEVGVDNPVALMHTAGHVCPVCKAREALALFRAAAEAKPQTPPVTDDMVAAVVKAIGTVRALAIVQRDPELSRDQARLVCQAVVRHVPLVAPAEVPIPCQESEIPMVTFCGKTYVPLDAHAKAVDSAPVMPNGWGPMPERASDAVVDAMLGSTAQSPLRGFDSLEDLLGFPSKVEGRVVVAAAYLAAVNAGRQLLSLPPLPDEAPALPEPNPDLGLAVRATAYFMAAPPEVIDLTAWFRVATPLQLGTLVQRSWATTAPSGDKRLTQAVADECGLGRRAVSEIQVDAVAALAWLRLHRPHDWAEVFCRVNRAEVFQEPPQSGKWYCLRLGVRFDATSQPSFDSAFAAAEHLDQVLKQATQL